MADLTEVSASHAYYASQWPLLYARWKDLLVAGEEGRWSLPGGHPEPGETIEQTLIREVQEEACAVVENFVYLGAQQIDDPFAPSGLTRYYQARFWARVRVEPFHPRFEIHHRMLATPQNFLSCLSWGQTDIAQALFTLASEQEQRFTSASSQ